MRATVWQQVAEIVAIREQIGRPVSKQLSDLACPADDQREAFADHLRAVAGESPHKRCPHDPALDVLEPAADDSVACGIKDAEAR